MSRATFYFDDRDPIIFEEESLMRKKLHAVLAAIVLIATHDRVVVNAERTVATALAVGVLRALGVIH